MNELPIKINKLSYKKDLLGGILDCTGNLDGDVEYADVVAQRKLARTRIQELEV
ncbi:MAG: hypothetical protein GXZ11_04780 [Tissierellia bacterium]|nr:hypothetical protein [Tissierellia bacterium]